MTTRRRFCERVGVPDLQSSIVAFQTIASGMTAGSGAFSGTSRTSAVVDMLGINRLVAAIKAGTGASGTGRLQLKAGTSTVASDHTVIVGRIGTNTAASATCAITPGQYQEIELDSQALGNNRYVTALMTAETAADDDAYIVLDLDIYVDDLAYEPRDTVLTYESDAATAGVQDPIYLS